MQTRFYTLPQVLQEIVKDKVRFLHVHLTMPASSVPGKSRLSVTPVSP